MDHYLHSSTLSNVSALLLVVDQQECAGLWIRMTLSGGELEQSMDTKLFDTDSLENISEVPMCWVQSGSQ